MIKVGSFEDVRALIITRIEEGLTLDYKRDLGNNKEMAKDISALANTEGGMLIYGINSEDRVPTVLSWIEGDNIAPPGPMIEKVYFKSRLIAYQGIIKAETGIEKNLANVEQELREQRRLREDSFPHRIRNTSIKAINLMNQLDWLKQAGFDEVDCLWKEMRRAIISGFKHAK
jgi:hypothetical protein